MNLRNLILIFYPTTKIYVIINKFVAFTLLLIILWIANLNTHPIIYINIYDGVQWETINKINKYIYTIKSPSGEEIK